ncbi:MAG: tyrosine--tRNA ligase [Pseudomonadota bacterium]
MTPKSAFLNVLVERGFLADCTDLETLDARLNAGVVPAYIGFDCTADSLHIGSLIQIMLLRWLQKTGGKPVVLMGGGTTRIGDPTGKDEARKLLTDESIAANMAGIRKVFATYLNFGDGSSDGPTDAVMRNNFDWLSTLNYIDFLRDYGPHFTINRMLTFDSVKLRLDREQPLTFLEFNYMLLQAFDFLELARREDVALQMGGSDQWGNIVNGVELNRRVDARQVFGLTTPLLTKADGSKMGKTAGGAVWLNAERLAPYAFWQYWRNTLDADVGRFLRLFTEMPLDEVARLEALEGAELNEAKKILATEVTALAHGRAAAQAAAVSAAEVFEKGGLGADMPRLALSPGDVAGGISIAQLLVKAGLAASGKEAKRLVAEGGARLDDAAITDAGLMLGPEDFAADRKLSAGKKRHALVTLG